MNKIQIMENMIQKYRDIIEQSQLSLESINPARRVMAHEIVISAKKQIIECEKIIKKEKEYCNLNCDPCSNLSDSFKEQAS